MPTKNKRIYSKAFNLIEAALVLGVVGLIIGAIWTASAAINERLKINEAAKTILSVAIKINHNISSGMAEQIGAASITTYVINSGILPADWVINGTPKSPWGGFVSAWIGSSVTTNPRVDFTLGALTPSQCKALALAVSRRLTTSTATNTATEILSSIYLGTELTFIPLPTDVHAIAGYCSVTQNVSFVIPLVNR